MRATRTHASGSSPLTWKIELVVHDDVHGAAGAVALQLREVERLGDDPLP